MPILKILNLVADGKVHARHKMFIIICTLVLTLEYLDILVYIYNTRELAVRFATSSFNTFLFVLSLFSVLWITTLIGKPLGRYLSRYFSDSQKNVLFAALLIAVIQICQAYLWISLVSSDLKLFILLFILRLFYQISLGLIANQLYQILICINEIGNRFIGLILNSLELSLLLGIVDCKILDYLPITPVELLSLTLIMAAIFWVIIGITFYTKYSALHFQVYLADESQLIKGIRKAFNKHPYDTMVATFLIGVRSCLSIIGVVFMPYYLASSLQMGVHNTSVVIGLSSLLALLVSFALRSRLMAAQNAGIIRTILVALIIGSLISYGLFFFKVIPFVAIAILLIFHSLFALICPLILGQLFTPEDRASAVVSCYGTSFFTFSSITFVSLMYFTDIAHSYYVSPAIFLITVTAVCYICMVLFNQEAKDQLPPKI